MIPPGSAAGGAGAVSNRGTGGQDAFLPRESGVGLRTEAAESPVLIIGGGIAGCSLAYALSRRGRPARLIEKGRPASLGASAVAAALLNPHRGRSGKPGPFDTRGLAAVWRLASELEGEGLEPGLHRSGVLRIASNERQARSWSSIPGMRRLEQVPPPYRAPNGAFEVVGGGWAEPSRLIDALVTSARGRGLEVVENVSIERVAREGGSWMAFSDDGAAYAAATLVLCLGAGEVSGVELPLLERVAGDQVTLESDVELPFPIAGSVYLTASGGRVFVGGNHRAPGTEDPRAPELLRASAARMVPPLAGAPIERVWTGVRAKRPDNVPLLEELEPGLWYLGAFGGRGFLTAPLLAERLAERLA